MVGTVLFVGLGAGAWLGDDVSLFVRLGFTLYALAACAVFVMFHRYRVEYGPDAIRLVRFWGLGPVAIVRWDEVVEIDDNGIEYIINLESGTRWKLEKCLRGYRDFWAFAMQRLAIGSTGDTGDAATSERDG